MARVGRLFEVVPRLSMHLQHRLRSLLSLFVSSRRRRFHAFPEEFRLANDFAFYLHDSLVTMVEYGEQAQLFNVSFPFKSPEDAKVFANLQGDQAWDWLQQSGYEWVLAELVYRQLLVALLADACHFIYEALNCSRKGKLAVTYALLRKPLRENLFYLEWLLADRKNLIGRFLHEGPERLLLSQPSVSEKQKHTIIADAAAKTAFPTFAPPDLLYDLRYSKDVAYGFEPIWHKAIHLVTTYHELSSTEKQNLNFIFSSDRDRLHQWRHLYSYLPLLLRYAVEVAEALMGSIVTLPGEELGAIQARRQVGYVLWARQYCSKPSSGLFIESIEDLVNDINLTCPNCSARVEFTDESMRAFWKTGITKCGGCRARIRIR